MVQLWINQPATFLRGSRLLLVFSVLFVQLAATKLILLLCQSGTVSWLRPETAALLAPYAFAPLVLSVLARAKSRTLRRRLRQPLDADALRRIRCAACSSAR